MTFYGKHQDTRDRLLADLWAKGYKGWWIAKKIGFTDVANVYHRAKALGLPPRYQKKGTRVKALPSEQRQQARQLWDEGLSRQEIARKLRLKPNTVKNWSYVNNWPKRKGFHSENPSPYKERGEERTPTRFTCQKCGFPCEQQEGHPGKCTAWVQYRYRAGVAA